MNSFTNTPSPKKLKTLSILWEKKNSSKATTKYKLQLLNNTLILEGELFFHNPANQTKVASHVNSFQRNLWQEDVLEVFLRTTTPGQYVEFNFSYTGAWWGAYFSDIRNAKEEINNDICIIQNLYTGKNTWIIEVHINLNKLPYSIAEKNGIPIGNICSIVYSNLQNKKKPTYSSKVMIPTPEPDFHQPNYYKPLL